MDKTTIHRTQTDRAIDTPDQALRQAMASVLGAEGKDLLRQSRACTHETRRLPIGPLRSRWPGGMHCHPYPEICIPITAGAAMDRSDGRFDLTPPALVVLEPQVMHCEAYRVRTSGYRILWMSLSDTSVIARTSGYTPRKGWGCVHQWGLRHACSKHLFRELTTADGRDGNALDRIRADVLILLSVMLRQSLLQSRPPGRRPVKPDTQDGVLERVKAFIDNHFRDLITLPDLAASAGLTANYLNHLFRERYGEPIHAYIVRRRMQVAMTLLTDSDLLIKQVALRSGFDDPLYFSRAFRHHHGISPSEARLRRA